MTDRTAQASQWVVIAFPLPQREPAIARMFITPQAEAGGRRLALPLLLSLLLAGCASTAESEERSQAVEHGATLLASRPDADSLAAAGVLLLGSQPASGVSLLTRAVEAAPERADLVWMQALACQETRACDPEPAEARLRLIDPTNGAGWMGRLSRADASHNMQGIDDALIAMSRSQRVDIFWTSSLAHLSNAASRDTRIPLQVALTKMTDRMALVSIPNYSPVSNACKGDRLNRTEVHEACRRVAAALMHGDSIITEMLGVAIAKRVWPPDSEEWKAADNARLRMKYVMKKMDEDSSRKDDDATAARDVSLLAQYPREQDFLRAKMIADGIDPDPPMPAK